ncbi:hypothetical protein LAZ67_8003736 [Cordylochernes scorpioides]|uniref:Uncharacterized protein n=1 Tax=Cordylochernes scorpioides TaxID=51811 RepID=A0ABY6KWW4_9ARAC|nr:hypothetical protein LAZ67_8003736 [Cordylochernes scorpioides]
METSYCGTQQEVVVSRFGHLLLQRQEPQPGPGPGRPADRDQAGPAGLAGKSGQGHPAGAPEPRPPWSSGSSQEVCGFGNLKCVKPGSEVSLCVSRHGLGAFGGRDFRQLNRPVNPPRPTGPNPGAQNPMFSQQPPFNYPGTANHGYPMAAAFPRNNNSEWWGY